MRTELLNYDLPPELIAQKPSDRRDQSRLLVMNRSTCSFEDKQFCDIASFLNPGDCLVLNNTKVLPARFFAKRKTGASLEGLFLDQNPVGQWHVMLKNARRLKENETIILLDRTGLDRIQAKVIGRIQAERWLLEVENSTPAEKILSEIGFAPLPPYIKHGKDQAVADFDIDRYQTVYAQKPGAVAAPTAGLHFTQQLLEQLKIKGVKLAYVTLHVGAGTFKPVTTENLEEHQMHTERFSLSPEDARIINDTTDAGGRIITVGTTSVRTLETIAKDRKVKSVEGQTNIFIKPGYKFKITDAMITNFHLPRSTLLALVAAFAGLDEILSAYKHAIENRYRFYSYGDAMLII